MTFDPAKYKRKRRLDPAHRAKINAQNSISRKARRKANPEKARAADKVSYYKNPQGWRKRSLKRYPNFTVGLWDAMFEGQRRCCAACETPEPGNKIGRWNTDHNHVTGKVRGILCHSCNLALGMVKDNPHRL